MVVQRIATCALGGFLLLTSAVCARATETRTSTEIDICIEASCRGKSSLDRAHVEIGQGVIAYPALTYAALRGYRPLTMDLYRPRKDAGPLPVIVLIHGGGWIYGSPRNEAAFADLPKFLADIAARGYAVASVSYRLGSEAPFPAALQDVKSAIRWLRVHAQEFGLDPERFVTWGGSAGGQLSAMAAVTCGVAKFEPITGDVYGAVLGGPDPAVSDCVQGAVAWYGAYDFTRPIGGPLSMARHPYFACAPQGCTREQLENPSAAFYVDGKDPPMLLVHGDADKSAPPAQSRHFLDVLRAAGVRAKLVMIRGADHGFRADTVEATRKAHEEALAASLAFTDRVTGRR